MKNSTGLFFALLALVVLNSCTNSFDLVKRHYNKGFYVGNAHHRNSEKKSPEKSVTEQKKEETALVLNTPEQEKKQENVQINKNENEQTQLSASVKHHNKTVKAAAPIKSNVAESNSAKATEEKELIVKNERKKHHERDLPVGGAMSDGVKLFLYIVLAIVLPPLAIYIKQEKITKWFWIAVVLCALAYFGTFVGPLFGLWFAAFIVALLVVLDVLT